MYSTCIVLLMNVYRLYKISFVAAFRDPCKTFPFAQFLRPRQAEFVNRLRL